MECPEAEVDLRVGGAYRIANLLPDGSTLWLSGTFEVVEPTSRLVYTWVMGGGAPERITVEFDEVDGHTDVVLRHERIATEALDGHEKGWMGCVDGLAALLEDEL